MENRTEDGRFKAGGTPPSPRKRILKDGARIALEVLQDKAKNGDIEACAILLETAVKMEAI